MSVSAVAARYAARYLDTLIGVFDPERQLRRVQTRSILDSWNQLTGGSSLGGYDAGKVNRLTHGLAGAIGQNENAIPRDQIGRLRWGSWELWRNNPHAKKIVRQLEAKVVGRNFAPHNQAIRDDGTPHKEFRDRAKQIWQEVENEFDYRGKPGRGGASLNGQAKAALRATILGGECLLRYRRLRRNEQFTRNLSIPLVGQLIHAERLDDSLVSEQIYYGVEVDRDDRRVAYHLLARHPSEPLGGWSTDSHRYAADDFVHLFVGDDLDQLRGTPWFSAILLKAKGTDDAEYNELVSAAMASCIVLGYRRATGQVGLPGIAGAEQTAPLTDINGNRVSNFSPGMLWDLGRNGELQLINPARNSSHLPDFINHMLRAQAAGVPGIKGTSLTGDYRESSFASEKAADNDCWPELIDVQRWMADSFWQPTYEEVLTAAVLAGHFAGIITADEFFERRKSFCRAVWQGPVGLSINPKDDARASRERVEGGQSTPQLEALLLGRNAYENLAQLHEYLAEAERLGIPREIALQHLGRKAIDEPHDGDENEPLTGGKETAAPSRRKPAATEPAGSTP